MVLHRVPLTTQVGVKSQNEALALNAPVKLLFGCCCHFSQLNEMEKGNYCQKFKINVS